MSECLAKQEQLCCMQTAFLYVGCRMHHLHMHRYKRLHTCKRFSSEEALQLAAFIKQQQANVRVPWQSIPRPVTRDSVWGKRNPGWMNGVTGPEHVASKWPALLCSPHSSGASAPNWSECLQFWRSRDIGKGSQLYLEQMQFSDTKCMYTFSG